MGKRGRRGKRELESMAKKAMGVLVGGMALMILMATAVKGRWEWEKNEEEEELVNLQARSKAGVIHLDDSSLERFAVKAESRSYSLIIFFDSVQHREKPELRLDLLRAEFELVASSFLKNNEGQPSATKVFLCDIEFVESQASFGKFGVNTLPHIRHVGPGSTKLKDAESIEQNEIGRAAEGIAAFVESKTKYRVGSIERPPPISKKQVIFVGGVLVLAAPFVVKRILTQDTPLHDPKVWLASAVFIYFFSVSGAMHNIIRKMPLFMTDRDNPNKLVFFVQGSGVQLGAEGFAVGFLYTLVGLLLAFVTHFLAYVKTQNAQRLLMLITMAVSFWAVKKVIFLDNWKTGYGIHGFWPSAWE